MAWLCHLPTRRCDPCDGLDRVCLQELPHCHSMHAANQLTALVWCHPKGQPGMQGASRPAASSPQLTACTAGCAHGTATVAVRNAALAGSPGSAACAWHPRGMAARKRGRRYPAQTDPNLSRASQP